MTMKKVLITSMACLWAAVAFANHWTPNDNFESNMTVTAVVQINGEEQSNANLELGVFCGEECRGSQLPVYISALNRYVYFTQVYGLTTEVFLFKLYDHALGEELVLAPPVALAFNEDGYGSLSNPYVMNYTESAVVHYTITAVSDPEEGGLVEGVGVYANAEVCTVVAKAHEGFAFLNWTEDGDVVAITANYSFMVTADRDLVAHFVPSDSHWIVNDNYEYDMTLTAVVQINGVEQRSENLELGVFCGDECRGVQKPTYIAVLDRYVYFTQVYSLQSDVFTFKLYDHGQGKELNLVSPEAMAFNVDGYGTLSSPQVLDFIGAIYQITVGANPEVGGIVTGAGTYDHGTAVTLTATANPGYTFVNWTENGEVVSTEAAYSFTVTGDKTLVAHFEVTQPIDPNPDDVVIELNPGWNWISYLLTIETPVGEALVNLTPAHGDMIKGQNSFSTYNAVTGLWSGSLSSMTPGKGYIYLSKDTQSKTFTYPGERDWNDAVVIELNPGWNWISYILTVEMPVGEALLNLTPANGDMIKGQNSYSTYNAATGLWSGSLTSLVPGKGYIYLSKDTQSKTFTY